MKPNPSFSFSIFGTLSVSLFLLASAAYGADSPALPSAVEVFGRHVQALGGKAAIAKLTHSRQKGKFELPGQGVSAELEVLRAKPDRMVFKVSVQNFGVVSGGCDGRVAWLIDPMGGARLLQGKMLDQSRDDARFLAQFQVYDAEDFKRPPTVARVEFDGKDCYEVKLTLKSGREETRYFEVASGLLAGTRRMQESEQGAAEAVSRFLEYKAFGGVQQATKAVQQTGETEITMSLPEVSWDPIPSAEFDLPEAVRALIKP
ncbi:MAG: hypothetical protein FJ387_09425 [Verrucomicrobia bacterium]|nr:hypothetical protein [Verrucomicrobiota bacterium]